MTDNLKIQKPFRRSFELWRESPKNVLGEDMSTSAHHADATSIAQADSDRSKSLDRQFSMVLMQAGDSGFYAPQE